MADDCTTCHFNRDGFCQRFPPQVTLYPTDNQHPIHYAVGDGFPSAMAGRWCGEWRARPEAAAPLNVIPESANG